MAPDDLVQLITALCAGGGLWLAVREIAKQVGETRRERIRQDAETERMTIMHVMPLPMNVSQSNDGKPRKQPAGPVPRNHDHVR
jgi:hypothetical protein